MFIGVVLMDIKAKITTDKLSGELSSLKKMF